MARGSTIESVVGAGVAFGATYLTYQLGLAGTFGADVQKAMQQIYDLLHGNKSCPENNTRGMLGPDAFGYRVKWRGQIVYRSTVKSFAQKRYDELCQSDPY